MSHLFLSSNPSRDSELLETPLTLGKNTLRLLGQRRHCQNIGYNTGLDQCRGNQPGKDRDAISIDIGRVVNLSATSLEQITRSRAGFLLPAKALVCGRHAIRLYSFVYLRCAEADAICDEQRAPLGITLLHLLSKPLTW